VGFDISIALQLFSGGLMLSSSFLIVHLVSTINPYNKPVIPVVYCTILFLTGLFMAMVAYEKNPVNAARESMGDAFVSVLYLLPLALAILTYNLLRISMKKRPGDELFQSTSSHPPEA